MIYLRGQVNYLLIEMQTTGTTAARVAKRNNPEKGCQQQMTRLAVWIILLS